MSSAIIGIGASAGGLEAVTELLTALPSRPGAAVVVVQHLDRHHDSLLSEILRRKTAMPVNVAVDGVAPSPNHVYVIPPNATLTVTGGVMVLAPRAPGPEIHHPVDALFRSLADECGDAAVGIVLSGADSDGAHGIQAIKQAGGITFAQTPESARVPSMPRSAIETGCVDFVLAPDGIARELVRLTAHPYFRPHPNTHTGDTEETEALRRVFRQVRSAHGVDFARYKTSTLRRRLARRMAVQKIDGLADYAAFLETDAVETAALYQDFLIRVTSFFRDPKSFEALTKTVFPQMRAGRSAKEPIRIWVPGCATGEEVYSIAIALMESMGESPPAAGMQLFGTDVSETSIEKCRAGVYPEAIALDVSAERLRRFFVKRDSNYVISRAIRDLCVFARHDVTRDPPYSRLDLISCRNLLIYLGTASQNHVMQVFRYALRPHGYLMLGPSESVGHGEEFFESVDKEHRLYRPKPAWQMAMHGPQPDSGGAPGNAVPASSPARGGHDFIESDAVQRQADRILLTRYSPAGMLVDESLNILQFRGHTAPYLAPASGAPSLNLMRIARPELMVAVPALLQEARHSGRAAHRSGIALDGLGPIEMEVIPLSQVGGAQCFLILLHDANSMQPSRRDRLAPAVELSESEKDQRLAQVERENFELREFLQSTMEQHEGAKEELKSAHEEVLSANEEFQSTNEELETSKEELQSANEELTTTNEELRERNRQLGVLNTELEKARGASERARAYADGIVETVRDPLVVLDGDLKVLRVNMAFCSEFGVTPDRIEGHSLDLVSKALWDDSLNEKLSAILATGPVLSNFEVIYNHPKLGSRVLCLNGQKIVGDAERSELILLAIEDVTESRRRNDVIREGSQRKDEFLAMLAHELRNPLGAISHALHVLKIGASEHVAEMHMLIERQTSQLVRLVNDLLDVARINRGLIDLQRRPIDLTPIVRGAAEAAHGKILERRHVLEVAVPDAPVSVEGDPARLEQVLANLIENAIKYTDPGGHISVSLVKDGSDAVLRVADNGIGIPPEKIRQVFDLFTQVDNSLARAGGGLGLGLTVVRRVVELHGGSINVRSPGVGLGSEFILRLPLISAALLPEQADDTSAEQGVKVISRRVLIVDDNQDAAAVMSLVFTHWGHDVRTAETGNKAMEVLEKFAPEVAFIDIGLPDIDGYQLAARLRAIPALRPARLIALTGYGTEADRKRAMAAGFDEHLIKPADADSLARLLTMPLGEDLGPLPQS